MIIATALRNKPVLKCEKKRKISSAIYVSTKSVQDTKKKNQRSAHRWSFLFSLHFLKYFNNLISVQHRGNHYLRVLYRSNHFLCVIYRENFFSCPPSVRRQQFSSRYVKRQSFLLTDFYIAKTLSFLCQLYRVHHFNSPPRLL